MRLLVALLALLLACLTATAQTADPRFGGPAPRPSCSVAGWPQCIAARWVQGAQAAVQAHCEQFAAAHVAGGGIVFCGQVGSTSTTCELANPAIPAGYEGGQWASTQVVMGGRDVEPFNFGQGPVWRTWGPSTYAGPTCACPANALITPDASCACPARMRWDANAAACVPGPPTPLRIQLTGRSRTRALPAGPVLPLAAVVTKGESPAAGIAVTISQDGHTVLSGSTDAAGQLPFTWVPPQLAAGQVRLTAACSNCENTDTKTLVADPVQTCDASYGNPIQPASGQKLQDERDWEDQAPHALTWGRHYRSQGNVPAGLGAGWSHRYAGRLRADGESLRIVELGEGTQVRFEAGQAGWLPDNRRDALFPVDTGWVYQRAADDSQFFFTAEGQLTRIRQRNGWTAQLAYDAAGQLISVTNAFGRRLSLGYSAGLLTQVHLPDGGRVDYGYDGAARLAWARWPNAAVRQYLYEDPRWPQALTGIVDEAGVRSATYAYDAQGRAVATQTEAGTYGVQFSGGVSGTGSVVMGRSIDPALYRLDAWLTDPQGTRRQLTWTGGDGQVRRAGTSEALPGEPAAQRQFDMAGLPVLERDFLGVDTTTQWDPRRRLPLAVTRAAGLPEAQTVQTQWHAQWRLPVLVTESGRSTAYEYDAGGHLIARTATDLATGEQRRETWTYNAQGLMATATDARGAHWRFAYDDAGMLVARIDPMGQRTDYTYDGAGRVLRMTEPGGLQTDYRYDPRGRLLTHTRGGETTAYAWHPTGALASLTLPSGQVLRYTYDSAARLVRIEDNRGAVVRYGYDAQGAAMQEEVLGAGGELAQRTRTVFDRLGLVAGIQDGTGAWTRRTYDAKGQLSAETDPLNQSTRWTLDSLGRPIRTTFADGFSALMHWDAQDALAQVTDPIGVATTYTRSAFGDITAETSPDSGTVRYGLDAGGEVIRIENARDQVTDIEREALGRLQQVRFADGTEQHWSYDPSGRVSRIDDSSGSTSFQRDALGRITQRTQTVNDNPRAPSRFSVGQGWEAGELARIRYPSGLRVFYQRQAGRIVGIDVQLPARGAPRQPWITDIRYTGLGQPSGWQWRSGARAQRSFDAAGRITATEFAQFTHDAAGRIAAIDQTLWARGPRRQHIAAVLRLRAGHDVRNRLTRFAREGAEVLYTYDPNGNRLSVVDQRSAEADLQGQGGTREQRLTIAPGSNRLVGITSSASDGITDAVTWTLDAQGALVDDGQRRYGYDVAGRLATVRWGAPGRQMQVHHLHNALGQRVFRSEPEPEQRQAAAPRGGGLIAWLRALLQAFVPVHLGTAYIYGDGEGPIPAWALLGEYDNGSAAGRGRTEYLWLPLEDGSAIPVGLFRDARLYAIHTDHLGTPRLVTDEEGQAVWQWPYSGFGDNAPTGVLRAVGRADGDTSNQPLSLRSTSAALELNLRFPGQYADGDTGLSQNYFRFYSAEQGRYLSSDPVGMAGGMNRFTYVEGNPTSRVDPLGLECWTVGFFPGVGGQITFGQNPNGSGFTSLQFGWGLGGGFTYNPLGKQPGYDECQGASWGMGAGIYAQASFRAGPVGASAGANLGRNFRATGSELYRGIPTSAGMKDRMSGLNASMSGGGQMTLFGGGTARGACTCGR
ncbi:RHS repeat-associated core domain-containing protein [Ramlibacter rhizophilus]|uniref:RHS repeat protein n=1 Tax=Ramlibacter rhizophilus TaxID=1781167 RepID=A0A4Z0BHD4_9BURK|nr:RHS repeat-associated core domain-containing protein [Ramlibacter rhizophilus]TFY98725.1 hypothetical protein EZ242_14505 [Ramlibacter rhizophilus]